MGIMNRGRAEIRTNGPGKGPPKEAPKKIIRWHKVLMTHAGAGNTFFKKDSWRGVTSQSEAESLAKRGLIHPQHEPLPEDAVSVATNPAEAMPGDGKEDKVRDMLNQAARTAWKPGMKAATPSRNKKKDKGSEETAAEPASGEAADTSESALPRPKPRRAP